MLWHGNDISMISNRANMDTKSLTSVHCSYRLTQILSTHCYILDLHTFWMFYKVLLCMLTQSVQIEFNIC